MNDEDQRCEEALEAELVRARAKLDAINTQRRVILGYIDRLNKHQRDKTSSLIVYFVASKDPWSSKQGPEEVLFAEDDDALDEALIEFAANLPLKEGQSPEHQIVVRAAGEPKGSGSLYDVGPSSAGWIREL